MAGKEPSPGVLNLPGMYRTYPVDLDLSQFDLAHNTNGKLTLDDDSLSGVTHLFDNAEFLSSYKSVYNPLTAKYPPLHQIFCGAAPAEIKPAVPDECVLAPGLETPERLDYEPEGSETGSDPAPATPTDGLLLPHGREGRDMNGGGTPAPPLPPSGEEYPALPSLSKIQPLSQEDQDLIGETASEHQSTTPPEIDPDQQDALLAEEGDGNSTLTGDQGQQVDSSISPISRVGSFLNLTTASSNKTVRTWTPSTR